MHDIVNSLSILQAAMPQTIQGSAVTTGNIDMQGAETLAVVVMLGDVADTLDASHRIDIKIEHAEDDGTGAPGSYSPCADSDVLNAENLSSGVFASIDSGSKEQKRHVVGYRGGRRFVKVTATPVSLTTGGAIAMLAIKGNPAHKPQDNS